MDHCMDDSIDSDSCSFTMDHCMNDAMENNQSNNEHENMNDSESSDSAMNESGMNRTDSTCPQVNNNVPTINSLTKQSKNVQMNQTEPSPQINDIICSTDACRKRSKNLDTSEEEDDDDAEIDYSFVDDMLEESVNVESLKKPKPPPSKKAKSGNRQKSSKVETKKKSVLIKRGHDLFEILPEGWVEITHFSGIPIYLDKKSRVCTTAKPYHLGTGSARKHHIPLSSIPCLQYRIELDKEKDNLLKKQQAESGKGDESFTPVAKVETLEENKKERSLDYSKVREYCKRLFEFKTVTVRKFTNWAERRKHEQSKKLAQRPSLPVSTKLITCTIPKNVSPNTPGKSFKKEFIMNPNGKSDVCILHEYVQHMQRTQPKYVFEELESVSKPYCATVFINEMEYGKGYGSSKKEAKTEAARASLDILIPNLKDSINQEQNKSDIINDLNFFDNINIEDQRVSDLCLKTGQYSPYQVLVECIRRLYGIEDMEIKTEVKLIRHQKIEFKMTVGTNVAVVICKNKREGKQRAAQKILKSLHPTLESWGSLLKLYGPGSCKTSKEKKEEAQKITELQNNACSNRPNYAILNKLKEEMKKLSQANQLKPQENKVTQCCCSLAPETKNSPTTNISTSLMTNNNP